MDTKGLLAKGAGKDAASASVIQPQGVGGVTGGETWGKAETVGRRSRRMRVEVEMVRGRRRGGEEKEEEGRRSCMEDCSCTAASGKSLEDELLGAMISFLPWR